MIGNKAQTSMIGVACGAVALLGTLIWAGQFVPVVAEPAVGTPHLKIKTAAPDATPVPQRVSMKAMAILWQKQIAPPQPKPIPSPTARQPIKVVNPRPALELKLLGVAFRGDKPEAILRVGKKTLVMSVGDVVQGAQLVEIGRTSVRVNQAGRDVRLQLQLSR